MIHSVYIHIPFCDSICSYCDFCKIYYNSNLVDNYLNELKREIRLNYKYDSIDTIYIGGGTPSCLSCKQLIKLFEVLKIIKGKKKEYTIECNIENITEEKLKVFKKYGINRISIGVQTLNEKYIKLLNRHHNKDMVKEKINLVKKYFDNINIDLIYAIPDETIKELDEDLNFILNLDIKHISAYSLIIEEHTKLYIDKVHNIDEDLDYSMYNHICNKLKENGFDHYEISNFAKVGYKSKHNLTYWNNLEYYGFGMGASGYINNIRYDNTRSINKYLSGKYLVDNHKLDLKETIENEFILGLRKIKGINKLEFYNKYNTDINSIFCVNKLLKENKLVDDGKYIYINSKFLYTSNDILVEFIN